MHPDPQRRTQSQPLTRFVPILLCAVASMTLLLGHPPMTRAQSNPVVHYDLGQATVLQAQHAAGSRFHEMPLTLQGVLAVPEGSGPFPVVLFVHGAYGFCTAPANDEADVYPCPPEHDLRQYEGFSYLAQALADRGYLTIIPDLSAEFNNGFGEPVFGERSSQILRATLTALKTGQGFGVELAGRADFTRLVVATHSRGGPLALHFIDAPANADFPVAALAMLTPAYMNPNDTIPPMMPTALVIAECDGDVGTDQPLVYAQEQLPPLRTALTTLDTLPQGTHNAFSSKLELEALPKACDGATILDPQRQRAFTAAFLPSFFDLALSSSIASIPTAS